jgi:hypothetical protein
MVAMTGPTASDCTDTSALSPGGEPRARGSYWIGSPPAVSAAPAVGTSVRHRKMPGFDHGPREFVPQAIPLRVGTCSCLSDSVGSFR